MPRRVQTTSEWRSRPLLVGALLGAAGVPAPLLGRTRRGVEDRRVRTVGPAFPTRRPLTISLQAENLMSQLKFQLFLPRGPAKPGTPACVHHALDAQMFVSLFVCLYFRTNEILNRKKFYIKNTETPRLESLTSTYSTDAHTIALLSQYQFC